MHEIRSVAIVGCGLMGTGIIEACAVAGLRTVGVKVTGGDTVAVKNRLTASLNKAVDRGKLGADARDRALENVTLTSDLSAIAGCDLVIESAAETLPAKHDLLRRIAECVDEHTVIASNTSSLRLSTLAEAVPHPSRFLGLHFFSPANVMKLVEIGSIGPTAPDVAARVRSFCLAIGKSPVELGDHPGYVVNRLLVPYILHAIETLEQGVAGPEAIDTAMKLGCGHPVGPLGLADLIGLDVVFAMSRSLQEELRDSRYRCPPLLRRLVMAGSLGKKAGVGFYRYSGDTPSANPALFDFARPSLPPMAVPAA